MNQNDQSQQPVQPVLQTEPDGLNATQTPDESSKAKPGAQPFSEHIKELRVRLLICFTALFLGTVVGYLFHDELFRIITAPLKEQLYYTTPTGGFNAVIKISILFGIIVSTPIFVYQLGKFLRPAFRRHVKAVKVLLFSTFLAISGVLFAYFVALPAALHFLANIDDSLQALITVNEYINFVGAYMVGFAILFQLPLILLLINRIKPQKPGRLMRAQRWVVLVSFILAAIFTPTPDPINMLIMALPIIVLYQFSILLVWNTNRRESKKLAAAGKRFVTDPALIIPELPPKVVPTSSVYSAASYGTSAPENTNQQPTTSDKPARQPKLIMDIFARPEAPAPLK